MFNASKPSISRSELLEKVTEADILGFYLGITSIPTVINSPLRQDAKPSFGLYSPNGKEVNYIDFSSGDKGGCISLLMKLWNKSRTETYLKIQEDIPKMHNINCSKSDYTSAVKCSLTGNVELQCKVREWKQYDIEYWNSYGISLEALKYFNVYPISHKIIIKNSKKMVLGAEKYSYTFVEKKEGKITHKFYSPFNTSGFKWLTNHDKSVLGLWSQLPEKGKFVCICSSVKDALCLYCNIGIPCVCLQGEGYPISQTAINELKRRFIDVFICLDCDETGLKDAKQLAQEHTIINVVIPSFEGGKDISDFYKCKGKETFRTLFKHLFIDARADWHNDLPF